EEREHPRHLLGPRPRVLERRREQRGVARVARGHEALDPLGEPVRASATVVHQPSYTLEDLRRVTRPGLLAEAIDALLADLAGEAGALEVEQAVLGGGERVDDRRLGPEHPGLEPPLDHALDAHPLVAELDEPRLVLPDVDVP